MNYQKRSKDEIAARIAQDIPEGAYVNLGIGLPTRIANYLDPTLDVFLHSENGVLGMGGRPKSGEEDPDLINAGKEFITINAGASYFHHGDSFSMIRGGHIDICVLGAFQVAANGDIANWQTMDDGAIPAVGGAMDLAVGAKKIFVATEYQTREGDAKLVERCTYPITGKGVVDRIYTDLAVIDLCPERGFVVIEIVEGLSFETLQSLTKAKLTDGVRGKNE